MQYKYVDTGMHFQGLPARDLDDQDLTNEQKQLLAQGVALGMYLPPIPPAAEKKIKKLATPDELLKGSPNDKSLPQDPTAAG